MKLRNGRLVAAITIWLAVTGNAIAAEQKNAGLPEPLTLEYALSLADDKQHPALSMGDANIKAAEAFRSEAEADDDINATLQAQAQWIDPAKYSPYQQNDNHRLSLLVDKTLYDFGRQSSRIEQAQQNLAQQQFQYLNTRQQRRIEIMKKFFEVLLADQIFYRYNEEMAVAFIAYDRARDNKELGKLSDVEVAEAEVEYQKVRRLRTASQNRQRLTRNALAQALARPEYIPDTLAKPKLDVVNKKLPEVEELQKQAIENNPLLQALRAQLAAAQQAVQTARASDKPVLKAQLEAHAYSRETGSTDAWRAGVVLEVPLSKGGRSDARVAKSQAELYNVQAKLAAAELDVRQAVLQLWLELDALRIKRDEMKALMAYREINLDKTRALYELELKTNLGYTMVQFTQAEHDAMQTDFEIALKWAKLDALTGSLIKEQ